MKSMPVRSISISSVCIGSIKNAHASLTGKKANPTIKDTPNMSPEKTLNDSNYKTGKALLQQSSVTIGLLLALAACGGGGDDSSNVTPAGAPAPSLSIGLKQLQFSWPAVANTDHYRILVNPDGASGFTLVSGADYISTTSHSIDISVHLTDWVNSEYLVEACNADESSCLSSTAQTLVASDSIEAIGYFKAANPDQYDAFGWSVAISGDGNTLAIAAPAENSSSTGINNSQDELATYAGAVYLFTRNTVTGIWSQQAFIKPSNTGSGDEFGWSVSLSSDGNTLAVGALGEDGNSSGINGVDSDLLPESGAVYIFTRSVDVWSQQAYIKASNPDSNDTFGFAISLSDDGNTLAVGAEGEASSSSGIGGKQNSNTAEYSGAAYVFTRTAGVWSQQAYIKASNPDAFDRFGRSLALSGDGRVLAVGATVEGSSDSGIDGNQNDNSKIGSGAVYVFKFNRNTQLWAQDAYIKASNASNSTKVWFGYSVDLNDSGNTLAVGAPGEDSATTSINSIPDNTATDAGAAYMFQFTGSGWVEQAYFKASNTDAKDMFGYAIALSSDGNKLLVTAKSEDGWARGISDAQDNNGADSGAAYLFTRAGSSWSQQAFIKASNTGGSDEFGNSASLSGNATTLAIGAPAEGGASTGVNGDQSDDSVPYSGAAYLY